MLTLIVLDLLLLGNGAAWFALLRVARVETREPFGARLPLQQRMRGDDCFRLS